MRNVIGSLVIALVAVACGEASATPPPGPDASDLLIRQSPSPFQQVSAGPVSALIPDSWEPRLAGPIDDPRQGIVAGPQPQAWMADRPPLEGLAAMWIDGTAIGVPSDYYYLAATVPRWTTSRCSEQCRATRSTSWPSTCRRSRRGDRLTWRLRGPRSRHLHGRRPTDPWATSWPRRATGPCARSGSRARPVRRGRRDAGVPPRVVPAERLLRRTDVNGSSVADMLECGRTSGRRTGRSPR